MGTLDIPSRDTEEFLYRGTAQSRFQLVESSVRETLRHLEQDRPDIMITRELWKSVNWTENNRMRFDVLVGRQFTLWDLAHTRYYHEARINVPSEHWLGTFSDGLSFLLEQRYGQEGALSCGQNNLLPLRNGGLLVIVGDDKHQIWIPKLIQASSFEDEVCKPGDRFFEAVPG